jgi:WD40 repeat protein
VLRPAGAPAHVAFSPRTNLLATTGDRGVITLLDVAGGPEITLWSDPRYLIRDLSFSADGTRLLAFIYGSGSPASVVFDVARRMALSTNDTVGATTHLGIARLSSDNRRLYLSQADRQARKTAIRCLDAETRQEIWNSEIDSDYGVSALAVSPDDRFLVTGTGYEQTTVFVCDAHTGKLLTKLAGHTGWIGELVFSRDGRLLASSAADQSLRVWDTSSWTEITVLRGHGDEVHTVSFRPDGKLLASGGKDGAILLWDLAAPHSARGYHPLPQDVQYAAEVSPGTLLVMDFEFRPAILRLDDLKSAPVQLPAWFAPRMPARYAPPDLVGFYDQTKWLRICEIRNEFPRIIAELSTGGKVVRYPETGAAALAYCPGQSLLAWGEQPATVHILNLDPPARRVQISSALASPAPVVFSPDGKHLLLIGDDRQGLEIRDVNTGKLLLSADKLLLSAVPFRYDHGLLFANEGRRLAAVRSVPGGQEVVFWDLTQPGKPPTTFREGGTLVSLGVSPDGQTISVCSEDGDLVLYDAQTVERKTVLHGHLQGLHGGSFSPDGKSVVSGSGGREAVKLWHAETGQELLTLPGRGSLLRVWFVDRGNAILSGDPGRTGSWQLWRAPSWQEIADAEASEKSAAQ